MKTEKAYRVPTIVTLFFLIGLALWSRFEWEEVHLRHLDELRRFSDGIFLALDVSHTKAIGPGPVGRPMGAGPRRPPPAQHLLGLEPILQSLVEASPPIRYLALTRLGEEVAVAGENLALPVIEEREGDRIEKGVFFIWRRLGAPMRPSQGGQSRWARQPPVDGPSAVIGLDAAMPDSFRRQGLEEIALKMGLVSLGFAAVLLAWIQGIRRRWVANQLHIERTKGAHMEELSLAASGLAHETKNPLGIIRGLAQQLEKSTENSEEQRKRAVQIQEEADRAVGYLGNFISYARVQNPDFAVFDLRAVVAKALAVLEGDVEQMGVRVEIRVEPTDVWADSQMLLQMILNLLLNSLDASSEGGLLKISWKCHGPQGALTVSDEGRGIAPQLLEEVFKPYVTDRPDGHGLGLSMVRKMTEQQGWGIHMKSTLGKGTTVTISGIQVVGP